MAQVLKPLREPYGKKRAIMFFNTEPIVSRLRTRLFGKPDFCRNAVETVELSPVSSTVALSTIALPNEFDRVSGTANETTIPLQHHWTFGNENSHGPTVSRRFENVLFADGTVYLNGEYVLVKDMRRRHAIFTEPPSLHEAELCSSIASTTVFAHWVRDGQVLELLAASRGHLPITVGQTWPHEPGYRALTGLEECVVHTAMIENLWITDDRGLNKGYAGRFRELRERVRASVGAGYGGEMIYLCRGSQQGTPRTLMNEVAIQEVLEKVGFETVAPESMCPVEIAKRLTSAQLVVAVEGSAINHAQLALPTRSAILAIQPPYRFNAFHRHFTDMSGIRFAYVVGEKCKGGFTIDPDRLLRTIDLVKSQMLSY